MNSSVLPSRERLSCIFPTKFSKRRRRRCATPGFGERYEYSDADIIAFCQDLALISTIVGDVPVVQLVRDPDDDMIIACAIAAGADYLVTRDKDLLTLKEHEGIAIITPEAFLMVLRSE